MKSKSAATGVILWLTVAIFVTSVSSQKCKVLNNGTEELDDEIRTFLSDTDPAKNLVLELDIDGNSVTSAIFETVKYLDVEIKDAKIIIKTTDEFLNYEKQETTTSFANILTLTCADASKRPLTISSFILSPTNNNKPVFENLNNDAKDAYEFSLPMPFPKGVHVNWAFGVDMRALDYDIGNEDMVFSIEDPSGNFEIERKNVSTDPKIRYSFAIKTLKLLELTSPTSFTITATDKSPQQDSLTTTIKVDIKIDGENTTPLSPSFSNIFYQAEITDPTAIGPIETNEPITILDPPTGGEITLSLTPAPGNDPSIEESFTAKLMDGEVVIELIEELDPSALLSPVLVMELKAKELISGFEARTVVHILLPWDGCSQCPTTTTTTCPECPIDPTCSPNLSCPSNPTCPTIGTCATPPPCPTSAPCTTTTPPPPTSIEFEKDSYSATVDGLHIGPLFTVKAVLNNGDGTIKYSFKANSEEMQSRLDMDEDTGVLSLTRAATPGSYAFELIALYEEEGDEARVIGYLDVSSFGECEDGSTCFTYALVTVDASEASDIPNLLPSDTAPIDATCKFSIGEEVVPSSAEKWFTIDSVTGALSISKDSNVEDPAFDSMNSPQVRLRLRVECNGPPPTDSLTRLQESVTKNEMIVVVNIINRNEFNPAFGDETPSLVGYPDRDFAQQLFPGAVFQIKATDLDRGDNEKLRYSFERLVTEFSIDELTGEVYPVDGKFAYRTSQLKIVAKDNQGNEEALTATTSVTVQIVKESDTAVAVIGGASVQDVDTIIKELNAEHDDFAWGSLRTSYMADTPDSTRQRELDGGLLLVLYAINIQNGAPATHNKIKSMLSDLETSGWTVSAVETWKVAGGWDEGGGSTPGSDEGLTVAVITLSVIVVICLVAIAFIVYFTVYRRGKIDKMIAKYGIKNRTSFSKHRESIAVESAKKSHVKGLELPIEVEGEMEERKKSTVKFNDEPELIPEDEEVARL